MRVLKTVVILGLVVGVLTVCSMFATNYSRSCEVVEVEGKVITFEDNSQHQWKWECVEEHNFEVGQRVKLKMNTNGTDSIITDDVIRRVVE